MCDAGASGDAGVTGMEPVLEGQYEATLKDENFNVFYDAPSLVYIVGTAKAQTLPVDCALLASYFMLSAAARGLGTCWIAALDEREIKKILSVPDDKRVLVVMPVGYTDSWPEPRPRKPLEKIICYEKYS